ncbi:MAG TPA: elongation factor P maturation arginine rhamnosyltransferase EarP [Burkholderiaceae bacterium]|nr:elongation factor P maturation arginine rhamnosyltransferase EarP [Burkholderiaceae bacterium]
MGTLHWDVFCRVIDNFGDVGVCWRLARDLARRGQRVRLHLDHPAALRWMAPGGEPGVEVLAWEAADGAAIGDVVVEAFGCDPPEDYIAAMAHGARARAPVWINLEYLSAEDYVERNHGLASPRLVDPGRGLVKWFVYPGYAPRTGGLLREPGLMDARRHFDRSAWLAAQRIDVAPGGRLVSLFCYESAPCARLLESLAADGRPTVLATAPGAATTGVASRMPSAPPNVRHLALPWLPLDDYDRLLWASDLNFVRGEDSWVRAQWAGNPFVWQAYVQADGAHRSKVRAFLDRLLAGQPPAVASDWGRWHAAWNGLEEAAGPLPAWRDARLAAIGQAARGWRGGLARQTDLVSNLLVMVEEKR